MFHVTRRAARDLAEIAHFYAVERSNATAARRVVLAILDSCRRAGLHPGIGRPRPELGARVRVQLVRKYPYSVYYRHALGRAPIPVLRSLHQRRDVNPVTFSGR